MIKSDLQIQIAGVIEKLYAVKFPVAVDYPDMSQGDYATNVALQLAKTLHKPPMEIAEEINKELGIRNQELGIFEKIEVAKPGFINFRISQKYFIENIETQKLASLPISQSSFIGKKIMIEYTDPNPFKEFHIGHLYTNIVGEALARLLEANGAKVWRANYFSDVGMHVAKAIWGIEQKIKENRVKIKDLKGKSLEDRVKFLGQAYATGASAFEENEMARTQMQAINRLVYVAAQKMWQKEKDIKPQVDYLQGSEIDEGELNKIYELYIAGRKWSLAYFELIYKRLGTQFDGYYPESLAGERGYQLVKENIGKVFVVSEGAVIFPGEGYGLHTRVFINKLGLPTYEAKELGLAPWKYEDFSYDLSIVSTASEINEYFKVIICAMKQISPILAEKTIHIGHGVVRLPEGKISSRTGNVITGEWLLNEAIEKAKIKVSEVIRKPIGAGAQQMETAQVVGVGSVKYALLKSSIGKDVEFSFDESISFDGNSGPYLQYTFARTQSILSKAQSIERKVQNNLNLEIEERQLLVLLTRFPEIVQEAARRFAPNLVCSYLFDVAQQFNLFYQKHSVLNAAGKMKRNFRSQLTKSTGEVLQKGLNLLGIQAPERM